MDTNLKRRGPGARPTEWVGEGCIEGPGTVWGQCPEEKNFKSNLEEEERLDPKPSLRTHKTEHVL